MNRVFYFSNEEQRFDGTALYSTQKKRIVAYLGLDHRMFFEMGLGVEENGAIRFTSGRQFIFILGLQIPVPWFARGDIELLEWYDDEKQRFGLDLNVKSKLFGPLFGFNGWFDAEYVDFKSGILPEKFRPIRLESNE